ncbi:putative Monosaccharide-transporting ATPase [Vibrio nigripulchritudo SO65]|uniref:sugar ABC transporter ATP-binding protein n=1 Tax=Vibrio nigripulchritudo TaxID=28173 RepID=UPI0003B17BDC|nr:sugar ABC transporter ATP-binding protein [Vibrio nigripulchritudo]CCN35042.1 putative Monosaccharide-transporting ATPase [Vibrio nigripulchritudo AM115]CCN40731.1 putative Monosaccharide-transporting ATPase [Vibrio nigripulchritudo FTn2]CCN64462.1 putative Monosaccharide-transporting ATPase [Vibrio nigripulchritudo POn4]CCN77431.1 putative Monosaccharide-transporting ATPase [Vibrio nigripulchritudo SO65]
MNTPLLTIRNLSKSYGPIQIFSDISFDIYQNEIVGLAGENGAGKSTILKALAGVISTDEGAMQLNGRTYLPKNYNDAVCHGISMVFQEQALLPNLQVYENIFFGYEEHFPKFWFGLDTQKMKSLAQNKLEELGLGHLDATAITGHLPFHDRQMVEIARSFILADFLNISHPVILLDEPTAAIGEKEVKLLFDCITQLRSVASFIIVTHKLSEYQTLCDRLYILKDGNMAGELEKDNLKEDAIHELMVGRKRNQAFYKEEMQREELGPVRLQVSDLQGLGLKNISFDLHQGEVLGLGGLVGCGKEDVVRAIIGHSPFVSTGTVKKDGTEIAVKGRLQQSRNHGIGYVPKERKTEGILPMMSVAQNISLAVLDKISLFPKVLSKKREDNLATSFIEKLSINTSSSYQLINNLSGGNQQKAVLARWLARDVDVLILDCPTRGVDVGAKEEIFTIIRELTQHNVSVLLVTDDLLELIGLSNRILVMREGEITAEITAQTDNKPTEKDIVQYMV